MGEVSLVFRKAQRHLNRRDAVMQRLIKTVGPCTLKNNPDHFRALTKSIVSQQISTKAAAAITARLEAALAPLGVNPGTIAKATDAELRAAGLSAAKVLAFRDLAAKVNNGSLHFAELSSLSDEEIIANLVQVRGIGRWTAEMFLIFSLGRLDVLPVDDLGLRAGVRDAYGLGELPDKQTLIAMGESWRPYRSVATWYLWRGLGITPLEKKTGGVNAPRP